MRIIGITGTIGAGKGTIVELLQREYGFAHFSVRGYLLDIIRERGLPDSRDSMSKVANELRANNSPSYIAEQLLERAQASGQDSIIESIRTLGEVEALRKASSSFKLLAIDADPRVRFERAILRGSSTDHISFEEFEAGEKAEMNNTDPNKQNLAGCIALADKVFQNNGELESLFASVREWMSQN